MKPRPLHLTLLVCTLVGTDCNQDNSVAVPDETYIPLITNSWTDVARADHKFDLVAQKDSVSKGTFTGEEVYQDSTDTFPLTGSFSNRNITITVTRRGRDTTYAGRFTADTLIDLGTLKLFRLSQ